MRAVRAETLHAIVLLALIVGLGFSIWSAYETLHPATSACDVNGFFACRKVATSGDTSIVGIPYWSIGIGGFAAMLAVDVPLYATWQRRLLVVLTALSALGAMATAFFVYQELAVIGAVCLVCTGAHVSNLAVLVGSIGLWLRGRGAPDAPAEGEERPTA